MFQNYKTKTLKKDILSGIIVALVSIPISMGYARLPGCRLYMAYTAHCSRFLYSV